MPHEEAVRIILGDAGTHFDPAVCDAFARIKETFNIICSMSHGHSLDAKELQRILEQAA